MKMGRRSILICLFLIIGIVLHAEPRKKVGVVLSGGGAKGVAHIGALKVIEEAGIPIDYIAGTSMGSIIGGLYAIGYSPAQMDSMVRAQNWSFLLSDKVKESDLSINQREKSAQYLLSVPIMRGKKNPIPGGLIRGQNISALFSELTIGYHDSISYDSLPIPFACVSENVVNGDEVVFRSGILSTSMRASMAIPGVFTPVRIDSMVLVDGGMKNNYPVDVALAMGADIIIGIDVQEDLKDASQLTSVPDILMQIIDITCQANHQRNVDSTNLYVRVPMQGYSAASFNQPALDTLMRRGEEATRRQWNALIALKQKIGLPADYQATYLPPYNTEKAQTELMHIAEVSFVGVSSRNEKFLQHRIHIKPGSEITFGQLEQAMTILNGMRDYSKIDYSLSRQGESYKLTFYMEERYEKFLNFGARFDSEELASLLFNASFSLKTRIPSSISPTIRLGKRSFAQLEYLFEPVLMRRFNATYRFLYNDINLYQGGKRAYNTTYRQHTVELGYSYVWFQNILFNAGIQFNYYDYSSFLSNNHNQQMIPYQNEHLFSYYAKLHYDSFNKSYFPTKGTNVTAAYNLYTDNFYQYNHSAPLSAISASWSTAISLTDRITLLPAVRARILLGDKVPAPLYNIVGGYGYTFYMPQQISFAGIGHIETAEDALAMVGLKVRQRLFKNHFVTLTGNYGATDQRFFEIFNGKQLWGGTIGYAINSRIGPIEALIGTSNLTKRLEFYVNVGYSF